MTNSERTLALALGHVSYGQRPRTAKLGTYFTGLASGTEPVELTAKQEKALWSICYTYRKQLKNHLDADLYERVVASQTPKQ